MVKEIISKVQAEEIGTVLNNNKSFAIITHRSPDGDCIGAALAVKHYLETQGKKAIAIVPDDYPNSMMWLPSADQVLVANEQLELVTTVLADADVLIMVDFNTPSRMGSALEEVVKGLSKPTLLFDHHPFPDADVNVLVSDTSVSSTCELLYRVFYSLNATLNTNCATCLLTGMVTDTGGFSYNSSSPDFFAIVGALLQLGADKDVVFDKVFNSNSENRTRLMGYATSQKMETFYDFQTAIITLDKDDLERFSFMPGDTEGFVNIPLSIEGITKSIFVVEKVDGVKMSFRSKGDFAINTFASKYYNVIIIIRHLFSVHTCLVNNLMPYFKVKQRVYSKPFVVNPSTKTTH